MAAARPGSPGGTPGNDRASVSGRSGRLPATHRNPRLPGPGQADRDGLLGVLDGMLPFAGVVDLLLHVAAGAGRGGEPAGVMGPGPTGARLSHRASFGAAGIGAAPRC